ncbi:MAG: SusC/RagA family protein [Bacteroides sp. 43_46]|uniref:TonB-dependent receptor n=1 Tax=Bacteroides sp. 43_46 TaxID=1897051 RepID=UPI0009607990|nr:TonB-dependent receptor [Bacteroides sp. 43_46]OKZ18866.1 MAG: SusC/RagA family protein [Bacteroides sp. 43_46]
MRKIQISYKQRYLKYIVLLLLFYPLNILGAQGVISVKGQAMTIKQAIQLIEKNSNYTFFYNAADLKNTTNKNLNCEGTIEEVLKEVFKGSGITYMIKGNEIILKVNKEEAAQQQPKKKRTVTGTVVDAENGDPVIGATVVVKGQKDGVITDLDGNFTIAISGSKAQLEFSYIGYRKKTVDVGDLGVINVKMESDNQLLSEVVVVGAGTQKKVSVTGSITSVKGLELKAPSSSLTTSFAGKLAGVISMTSTGEPGAASEFYIRGVSTFGGRATPLILLDDVEISTADLNNIPAETIESFSILKDASATAIYGARGANGVMLITTKTGKENEKTRINVTVENSFNKPMNFPDFVNGATWMEMYNEAQLTRNPGATPKYSQLDIDNTRNQVNPYIYPDVQWKDIIFKNMNMNQRANVNISGGGSKASYYMSLQANHDTGLLDTKKVYSYNNNINNWGYNFQNNISYKITSTTKIDLHMNAQIRNKKGPNYSTSDLFAQMLYCNPINFPVTFPAQPGDTHIRFGNAIWTGSSVRTNPYAYMLSSFKEYNENTLNTSLKINQKLDFVTKGLSVQAMVNWKNWASSSYNRTIEPYYYGIKGGSYNPSNPTDYEIERLGTSGTDYLKTSDISKASDQTFYLDARVNYDRQFNLHHVTGMLMYMQREYRSSVLPERNQGFSGRFTYDYGQRYLVELNFGYNGTERLAKKERFEFFPAVSLGWVISNEKFFEPMTKYIDNLKIRGSYGLVGSDETGLSAGAQHFLYIDQVSLNNIGFTTGVDMNYTLYGPLVTNYAVVNGGWERVKKLDIGIDLELFRQLTITADYFNEKRYNILLHREAWPESLGYYTAKPWSNKGKVDNWGIELSVNWRKEFTKDLYVDFRGNFTYTENKYVNLDEPVYPYVWKTSTGKPLSRTTGYIAQGLFSSQEEIDNSPTQNLGSTVKPGDIKYRDVNGDGKIDGSDQVMISPYGTTPRIQYGLGMNVTYKKFDFGVFFNGSAKRTIMISGISPFGQSDYNVMQFIADDYWSESNPNPNAKYPRLGLTSSQTANNTVASTYWMRNGNFIRFKTLELGYKFKYGRVYLNGDNIAVFSPFKLWDPELSWNAYPLQRTFNIGVQLNF